VVDSSVLLAIVLAEDDARDFAERLSAPGRKLISAATLFEAAVAAERRGGLEARDRLDRLVTRIDAEVLVLKTLAGREKDLEDVRALLRSASKEIDLTVVQSRLRELGALIDDSTLVDLFDQQVAATAKKPSKRHPRKAQR
jgi:predicted nucleic acid-binding protein